MTVAICTWNRCGLLEETLAAMTQLLVVPSVSWELVVVNNNSTDATDQVLERFRSALPLRSVVEEKQGHSNARNRAVEESRGRYIVWTDDDVLVDRNWLAAYMASFAAWPDAVFFGGPITPWFEGNPPSWLSESIERFGWVLALRDFGAEGGPLTAERVPFGANFAIRRDVQSRFPYDPALGRVGDSLRSGDEVTVLRAILGEGGSGRWVPDALVRHWIPKERQTLRFFRDRIIAAGRGIATEEEDASGPRLFGRPRWLWRAWVEAQAVYGYHRIFSPVEKWFPAFARTAMVRGHLRGPFQPSDPSP